MRGAVAGCLLLLLPAGAARAGGERRQRLASAGERVAALSGLLEDHQPTRQFFWGARHKRVTTAALKGLLGQVRRAAARQCKTDPTVLRCGLAGGKILYRNHVFIDGYFHNSHLRRRRFSPKALASQPWLRWDAQRRTYRYQDTGAAQWILGELGSSPTLHRGACHAEVRLWHLAKKLLEATLSPDDIAAMGALLGDIALVWSIKPPERGRLSRMAEGLAGLARAPARQRRQACGFLLDLLANDQTAGDGYRTISTTPDQRAAKGWAGRNTNRFRSARHPDLTHQKAVAIGAARQRLQGRSSVLTFDFSQPISRSIARGVYAGVEGGEHLKMGPYVEVGLISTEARLHALEHLVAGH